MNIKSLNIGLMLTILFTLTSSAIVFAQSKFHYLSIEFDNSYNDSIQYTIDVTGLENIYREKLKPYASKEIKIKTENELFNLLGRLGWELYLIQDIPNKITATRNNYNGQLTGDYGFWRDGIYSKRKIYFKLEER